VCVKNKPKNSRISEKEALTNECIRILAVAAVVVDGASVSSERPIRMGLNEIFCELPRLRSSCLIELIS
jgi:hypothetical protein